MKELKYDPETGLFSRGSKTVGSKRNDGYIQVSYNGKNFLAHRLAWLYVHGAWPKDGVEHINRTKDDNRIANLREMTRKA